MRRAAGVELGRRVEALLLISTELIISTQYIMTLGNWNDPSSILKMVEQPCFA